jgi:hypothetical protein
MHGDRDVAQIGALVEDGRHARVEQAAQHGRVRQHGEYDDAGVRTHRTDAPDHGHAIRAAAFGHGEVRHDDVARVIGQGVEEGVGVVDARDDVVAMRLQHGFDPGDHDRVVVRDDHGTTHG